VKAKPPDNFSNFASGETTPPAKAAAANIPKMRDRRFFMRKNWRQPARKANKFGRAAS
jgi:hypothetical protein